MDRKRTRHRRQRGGRDARGLRWLESDLSVFDLLYLTSWPDLIAVELTYVPFAILALALAAVICAGMAAARSVPTDVCGACGARRVES